jgi:uncharacterized protein (DUF1015 family)
MADILPFQPYRYSPQAGSLENLVTQPYDKISPEAQARYLAASPQNFAHVILGERREDDSPENNVYTRAADSLNRWLEESLMVQDAAPGFYPYFQEFTVPDTGDVVTRKGFIALGPVADYSEGVVFRHEQTLKGPKLDRLELLRHIRAHTGQLFFLYSDPEFGVDTLLDEASRTKPLAEVTDEYDVVHRMWCISDPVVTTKIRELMADKKLLIADGHHRYETARAFSEEHPELAAARHVMMTLVNMHSPGLKILATHRLVHSLDSFDIGEFLAKAGGRFSLRQVASEEELKLLLDQADPATIRIGVAGGDGPKLCLLEKERAENELDVAVLHDTVLDQLLGISPEAVRNQTHTRYIRGLGPAVEQVREGAVQAAFLLPPTSVQQTADISFGGGVMPQKSTDFYPKLLSGLTLYRMD